MVTGRRPQEGTAPGTSSRHRMRRIKMDFTARRLIDMDAVLLDPQRLYDTTLCSPDEFDYILHLYEKWVEQNHRQHFFRSENTDEQAGRGTVHLRHALLMGLADKRANVPMIMLADLFGTDADWLSTYLSMTDTALTEVLSEQLIMDTTTVLDISDDLMGIDLLVPMVSPDDPVRPRTAENYPGLLPSKRMSHTHPEDADMVRRRVEGARGTRKNLSLEKRLKQYRRLTDPYSGHPGLDIEFPVIMGLENFHLIWDQIRQENISLLRMLAKKRNKWGVT